MILYMEIYGSNSFKIVTSGNAIGNVSRCYVILMDVYIDVCRWRKYFTIPSSNVTINDKGGSVSLFFDFKILAPTGLSSSATSYT